MFNGLLGYLWRFLVFFWCGHLLLVCVSIAEEAPAGSVENGKKFVDGNANTAGVLTDPTAPPTMSEVSAIQQKPMILQAIIKEGTQNHAIINNRFVSVGDKVDGATVLAITAAHVEILRDGRNQLLAVFATVNIKRSARGGDIKK